MSGLSRDGQNESNLFFHVNMEYRRIIVLCFMILVGILLPAQTLHFVFFGDTDDDRIDAYRNVMFDKRDVILRRNRKCDSICYGVRVSCDFIII